MGTLAACVDRRVSLLVERNSEFGTRASVGAVYDRAFFRSLTTARGHRPRLQWYQSHCYALLVETVVNKRRKKPRLAQHRFCVLRRNIFQQYTPHVSTCVVGRIPTTV